MSADWILNHLPCSMHSESFLIWTIGLNGFSRTGTVPYPLLLISLTFLKPPSNFKIGLFFHALRIIKRCGSLTAYGLSHQRRPYPFPCSALLAGFAVGADCGAGDRHDLAESTCRAGTSSFRKIFA